MPNKNKTEYEKREKTISYLRLINLCLELRLGLTTGVINITIYRPVRPWYKMTNTVRTRRFSSTQDGHFQCRTKLRRPQHTRGIYNCLMPKRPLSVTFQHRVK